MGKKSKARREEQEQAEAAHEEEEEDKPSKKSRKAVSEEGGKAKRSYREHAEVRGMDAEAVAALRVELDMQVHPEEAALLYAPLTSFEHLRPSLSEHS